MLDTRRVGDDESGNPLTHGPLTHDVSKYLFIDYVVGLLEAGATHVQTFTSECGAEIKRESDSTLTYQEKKGAVLPIKKDGEALVMPNPRVDRQAGAVRPGLGQAGAVRPGLGLAWATAGQAQARPGPGLGHGRPLETR